jgi:2',3'-cyclic-nucleotide 2'-phosphodiesterase (5'-nucleotidase family)
LGYRHDRIKPSTGRFSVFVGQHLRKATGTNAEFALPYMMIDRGGVRIGIIGTIGATLESSILTSNVLPYDFVASGNLVRQSAANLRDAGADVIVLLNHNGEVESGILSEVDVVFNAHTHETYSRLTSGVPVIQAGYNGRAIGHVTLTYTASTDTVAIAEYGVDDDLVDLSLDEDPDMKAIYDQYLEEEINEVKKRGARYRQRLFFQSQIRQFGRHFDA